MKYLYILIGLILFPLVADITDVAYYYKNNKITQKLWFIFNTPGYGSIAFIKKDCTKDVSQNGHGWVFVNREFFQCGPIQIYLSDLIFGEYTHPINPKLLIKLKEGK